MYFIRAFRGALSKKNAPSASGTHYPVITPQNFENIVCKISKVKVGLMVNGSSKIIIQIQ